MPCGDPGLVVVRRAGGAEGDTITDRPGRRATCSSRPTSSSSRSSHYGAGERGAEPHVHREHADGFLVVDGEFTFHFRDGSHALPAGTLLFLPPNVVHGFDNDSRRTRAASTSMCRRPASGTTCAAGTPASTSTTRPRTVPSPDPRSRCSSRDRLPRMTWEELVTEVTARHPLRGVEDVRDAVPQARERQGRRRATGRTAGSR